MVNLLFLSHLNVSGHEVVFTIRQKTMADTKNPFSNLDLIFLREEIPSKKNNCYWFCHP